MTLHKLHAGDGYTYLTRQVAASDMGRTPGQSLADYYVASGNPPGRWLGSGGRDLGLGGRVEELQMRALFGKGLHPDAEQIIALEVRAGALETEAARAAKLGRAFPAYTPLRPRAERVAIRITSLTAKLGHSPSAAIQQRIQQAERRKERKPVAGYDLVFTPVKSVSILWGLGPAWMREQVEEAHHAAVADTLAWLERETAFGRVGTRGEQQIETRGFIAAAFDHFDSRAGDPDLHTHVAIANKVRALQDRDDGTPRWLALDARALHAAAVAASERYNTRIEDQIVRRLGVEFVDRPGNGRDQKRVIREVDGVPVALILHFSRRRAAIETRLDQLTVDYRLRHGRDPDNTANLRLAQQATLETRQGKPAPVTLAAKIKDWRAQAVEVVGAAGLEALSRPLSGRASGTAVQNRTVDEMAQLVLAELSARRSTWTRWNVIAEAERQLRAQRFVSPADREIATTALVDRALSPDLATALTPSDGTQIGPPNAALSLTTDRRRRDGSSVLIQHGAGRWTVPWILNAERRLLEHAAAVTSYAMDQQSAAAAVTGFDEAEDGGLDASQRSLAVGFASDPRRLVVGIGPAGGGKTTAMRALAHAWSSEGRRLVPLAPTAAAAEVLSAELGCRAENLHKFHHALTQSTIEEKPTADGAPTTDEWFTLRRGDLVLVDEAGMAGTKMLDWLTMHARERGALVRLLGDPAQMSPVEAGGALSLLAQQTSTYELTDLHRFANPDEAAATLAIRNGDRAGLDLYLREDRVRGGIRAGMTHDAFTAWTRDTEQGLRSLLVADTAADVRRLNSRARATRVATGDVDADGVALHDQTRAGVGDVVVTRRNDRRLTLTRGAFVKNGDHWTVTARHADGSLGVRHTSTGATTRLPAEYVARDVELGYAITVTRAQGATADSAHALISARTTREALYVALTRARHQTTIYVATSDTTAEHLDQDPASPEDVLEAVLAHTSAQQPATPLLPRTLKAGPAAGPRDESPSSSPARRQTAPPVHATTGPVQRM